MNNIDDKIQRSKSSERIDFDSIGCKHQPDSLVKVVSSERIVIEPIWTVQGDFEGNMYADYIAEHPDYDGVYIRTELLKRLKQAASLLDDRYALVVRAGHRPIAIQKRLLIECAQDYMTQNPGKTEAEALDHARTYVSDPDVKLPPHCCGAAIDVDLFDKRTNELVDFGSPMNLDSEISHLHYSKITPSQKTNRLILLKAMLEAGFASYYAEWWHFSYGDQIWAWFYGEKNCLYDPTDLTVAD